MAGGRFSISTREWALCGVTAFWGTTFLVVRLAMEHSGPLWFVGLRFSAAALAVLACSLPLLPGMTRRELWGGALLGCATFAGFALQTAGLASIPAAKSAFITAAYVPLVPLFELALMRRRPGLPALLGMALAFPGVLLLSGLDGLSGGFGSGEALTLLCAVAFALEIVATGMIVPATEPRRIVIVELSVCALLSFAGMPLTGEAPAPFSWLVAGSACGLGLGTALIQSVIAWAQQKVPPTRATVIYTAEPVWGGLVGYAAGERLPATALLGCALVIAGILAGSRRPRRQAPAGDGTRH